MHHLQRDSLHLESDLDRFFRNYFGEAVLQQLDRPQVGFSTWPQASRSTLRRLCIRFAEAMPEADHVVREDVDTRGHAPQDVQGELLLYFGVQGLEPFQRRQYTGVALARRRDSLEFITYIAGASSKQGRDELVSLEDPGRLLDCQAISCITDAERLVDGATSVLQAQRKTLIAHKGSATSGFCPAFCQQRWHRESRLSEAEATNALWTYWCRRRTEIRPEQVLRERELFQVNNRFRFGRAVAYVRDHVAVEEAYGLALSEHA